MSKIHIGEKNGRMGLWVAAPGFDASAEGGRMVLDSDLDYLKIHAQDTVTFTSNYRPPDDPTFYEFSPGTHYQPISFPALPYIPLVFYACHENGRIHYPSFSGWGQQNGVFRSWRASVGNNYINPFAGASILSDFGTLRFHYIVFENKVQD